MLDYFEYVNICIGQQISLVMELLGRVAVTGDVAQVQGHRLEVGGMTRHRIETVTVTPRDEEAENGS